MTESTRPSHSAIKPPPLDEVDETLLVELIDALCASARRGEQPDVEETARRHPRLASELRSLWATIWVAETLALPHPSPVARSAGVDHSDANPEPTVVHAGSERFGDYLLLDELGRGGMGVVYRAREPGRDRIVALKRLPRGPRASVREVDRFRAEATAASHLAHPHVVPVFRVGDQDGQPYFTMQYVEGTTLARRLAEGPMHD